MCQSEVRHKKWVSEVYLRDDLEQQQQLEHELHLSHRNAREAVLGSVTHATSRIGSTASPMRKCKGGTDATKQKVCYSSRYLLSICQHGICGPRKALSKCRWLAHCYHSNKTTRSINSMLLIATLISLFIGLHLYHNQDACLTQTHWRCLVSA